MRFFSGGKHRTPTVFESFDFMLLRHGMDSRIMARLLHCHYYSIVWRRERRDALVHWDPMKHGMLSFTNTRFSYPIQVVYISIPTDVWALMFGDKDPSKEWLFAFLSCRITMCTNTSYDSSPNSELGMPRFFSIWMLVNLGSQVPSSLHVRKFNVMLEAKSTLYKSPIWI